MTMTREHAVRLVDEHGSQRAAARAAGVSNHTIARAIGGQGAHRGTGDEWTHRPSGSMTGRNGAGPTSIYDEEGVDANKQGAVLLVVVVLVVTWVAWSWRQWNKKWAHHEDQEQGD